MKKINISKYGFKLEDFSNRIEYTNAIRKAYRNSPKGKLARFKAYTKYRNSQKGKLAIIKSNNSYPKTEIGKLSILKYRKTEKGIKSINKYLNSEKGKLAKSKSGKKYSSTEKGKIARKFFNAKRRAAKLQRTPAWADLEAIKKFYDNCPEGYAVDHIVPLQGVNISGLHVLNNLQYLTKSENSKKGNRYAV